MDEERSPVRRYISTAPPSWGGGTARGGNMEVEKCEGTLSEGKVLEKEFGPSETGKIRIAHGGPGLNI